MDARNNVVMVLQNGRGATFGASNAFFNTSILAAQVGGAVKDSTKASISKFEMFTAGDEGKATLTYTPVGDVVIYELNTDGSFKTATASTGVTAEGKSVTGGVKDSKYLAVYEIEAPAVEQITALADAENELLNVTAEVLLRDLCSQEIYFAFLFMKGKLSGEAEWGMARDGAHAFEITAMPAYCDAEKKLVDIVIVKDETLRT